MPYRLVSPLRYCPFNFSLPSRYRELSLYRAPWTLLGCLSSYFYSNDQIDINYLSQIKSTFSCSCAGAFVSSSVHSPCIESSRGPSFFLKGIFLDFSFYVRDSTLLHLPPLRFHCVEGCLDRTKESCDYGIGCQTLYITTWPDLIHILFF